MLSKRSTTRTKVRFTDDNFPSFVGVGYQRVRSYCRTSKIANDGAERAGKGHSWVLASPSTIAVTALPL